METKELRACFTQKAGADLPVQVEAELKLLESEPLTGILKQLN